MYGGGGGIVSRGGGRGGQTRDDDGALLGRLRDDWRRRWKKRRGTLSMMNAQHRIATVVLRRRRRQWRCLRRGDFRRRRWRRSRRARHDRRCRGHGVLPRARQKNVDDGCYNDKKEALFFKTILGTRKKSSSTATSLWTLSVRGSQMASVCKRRSFGGTKKIQKKL